MGDLPHAPHICRVIRAPHAYDAMRSGHAGNAYRVQGANPYGNSRCQAVLRAAFPSLVPKGTSAGAITWLGPGGVAFVDNLVTCPHHLLAAPRSVSTTMLQLPILYAHASACKLPSAEAHARACQ